MAARLDRNPRSRFPTDTALTRDEPMWHSLFCTFGPHDRVSCGKFRTTRLVRFSLLCLMFGLFVIGPAQAQRPDEGSPPNDSEREGRGARGGGEDRGRRGRFDPAEMASRLDEDKNGIISSSEIERAPSFMRDNFKQQGLDFHKGVRVEELQGVAQRSVDEMRRQRDEGRDGRSDRPELAPRGEVRTVAPAPATGSGTPAPKKPKTRVAPLLPEAFKAIDTDLDCQIALYEWRQAKRGPISQFTLIDTDGDGFLTPKELAKPVPAPAPTNPETKTGNATTAATSKPDPPAVAPAKPPEPVTVSTEAAVQATRAFEQLDGDRSGTVAGEEWSKSSRLKPLYVKGGYDLSKPLSKEEFTQAFVRVGAVQ